MKALTLTVICLYLVGAENVKAECKNNDGKVVPCQTSEEHIEHLTRALTYGSGIDQRLAPNSYSAEVEGWGGYWNGDLRDYTKTFDDLNPKLTFERQGKSPVTLSADDIYAFRNGLKKEVEFLWTDLPIDILSCLRSLLRFKAPVKAFFETL